jgi:FolB domain-containing protein
MAKNADWLSLSKISLSFPCVVGLTELEQRGTQTLELELAMNLDLDAAASGDLRRSVDYAAALDHVQFIAQRGRWMLLESMAAAMARLVLAPPAAGEKRARVRSVVVRLQKPDVFGGRAVPSVEIQRDQDWYESRELVGSPADKTRIEVLLETRHTGAYRIHLAPGARWSAPCNMALQVISGRVAVSGEEIRPRATLEPKERVISTPDEVFACLLGVCQPPLAPADAGRSLQSGH